MTGIQIVLLTGIVFIGLYFIIRWKKRVLDIILLLMMIGSAIISIVWPSIPQKVADKLGVGRGADLVFYLSILIFWFVVLKLYIRIRNLEQSFAEFIRTDAINKVQSSTGPAGL